MAHVDWLIGGPKMASWNCSYGFLTHVGYGPYGIVE